MFSPDDAARVEFEDDTAVIDFRPFDLAPGSAHATVHHRKTALKMIEEELGRHDPALWVLRLVAQAADGRPTASDPLGQRTAKRVRVHLTIVRHASKRPRYFVDYESQHLECETPVAVVAVVEAALARARVEYGA